MKRLAILFALILSACSPTGDINQVLKNVVETAAAQSTAFAASTSAAQSTAFVASIATAQSTPLPASTGAVTETLPLSTQADISTPEPQITPVDLKTNSEDRAEIVFVPSGSFLMGSDPNKDPYFWGAEAPEHTVTLNAFWIYRTEVTQGMYQNCVLEQSCSSPKIINDSVAQQYGNSRFSNYPVVMVSWQDAYAYCQWARARLPTEAEWEKAARGTDGRLFPWGDDPNVDGRANYSSSSPSSVGSYPAGASPYGAYDMAGNVLEWVNDYFDSSYYQYSPLDNPTGPASGSRRIIRGGAFTQNVVDGLRTVARASLKPSTTNNDVGFRCAMDAP